MGRDHQHRLVGLPAALPLPAAERLAVLAGDRRGGRRDRTAGAQAAAGRPGSRSTTPGVKHVAWTITPSDADSESSPRVWRAGSNRQTAPGSTPSTTRSFTRSSPAPSTTAHTPPASYGP